MKPIKITPTLLDSDCSFNPIKYFISKHSFYPDIVEFPVRCDISILFERLKDKFNEFQSFSKSEFKDNKIIIKRFCLLFSEGGSTIIFTYNGYAFTYYTDQLDEGLLNVISTIISSSNEK